MDPFILARYGHPRTQKTIQKRSFSPAHCFHTFPGIYRRFRPKVLSQTPHAAVFLVLRAPRPSACLVRLLLAATACLLVFFWLFLLRHFLVQPSLSRQLMSRQFWLLFIVMFHRLSANLEIHVNALTHEEGSLPTKKFTSMQSQIKRSS